MIGRIGAVAGLTSAAFGIVFGVLFPWGGFAERSSAVVFGLYTAVALAFGYRSARDHRVAEHRRWMIRAFAVALGVATVRVILSVGEAMDLYQFDDIFGRAFWAGFTINAVFAELWLWKWPTPSRPPRRRPVPART